MLKTLKVVKQGEPVQIDFGNDATSLFHPGELVLVKLKFQVREYNGQLFQDINVQEIIKLKF